MKSDRVKIGNVLHPVADVDTAVRFYTDIFGLATMFVDGDRYAALDAGSTTLALAGPTEDITGGVPAASFKVPNVASALAALVQDGGGSVVRELERGPHEERVAPLLPPLLSGAAATPADCAFPTGRHSPGSCTCCGPVSPGAMSRPKRSAVPG